MRIPAFIMQETVTVQPYEGDSAFGPVYGDSFTVKAYGEQGRRETVDQEGREVTADAWLALPPDTAIKAQDRVDWLDRSYAVVNVAKYRPFGKPSHIEAELRSRVFDDDS